ncbi:MAG: arylformamidase [Candidatus Krumholzibacteriia bacterium]|jgi:arylformamidase
MQLIDLSHTIKEDMRQWPGDEQPLKLHRHSTHDEATYMSSSLEFGCHVGTHIDAPLHFLAGALGVDEIPLDHFVGSAMVIRCGDGESSIGLGTDLLRDVNLETVDFVIFDTQWSQHWGTDRYYERWSYLTPELAHYLAQAGLKGVGLDTPSLDHYAARIAHDICAPAGMINIENLTNLNAVPDHGFTLQVVPLKLNQTEASPVRALAILET